MAKLVGTGGDLDIQKVPALRSVNTGRRGLGIDATGRVLAGDDTSRIIEHGRVTVGVKVLSANAGHEP